jgi:hypothetical protein
LPPAPGTGVLCSQAIRLFFIRSLSGRLAVVPVA